MKYDADIFDAVEWGDLETVKIFWTDEIDVDWQDLIGMNLLMYAVKNSHREIVKYILQFNPNLHLLNKENETVFQIAQSTKNNEIYQLLLSKCLGNS